jgi:hypothetical protein
MAAEAAQQERERVWDGTLRREIDVELRSIDAAERSFDVIASTESLDSHGDVMKQFWDLSRFTKTNVVLWNHNRAAVWGDDPEAALPIGRAENVRVEGKKLLARIFLLKCDAASEPLIDKIWRRVEQRVLKGVSVGFRAGQVVAITNAAGDVDHYELGSKERPNELREISLVPMGSNPDAVAKSIAWEREHLKDDVTKSLAAVAAENEGSQPMGMTAEEQKTLDGAVAAKTAAETRLTDEQTKSKKLETELNAEKAISAKLSSDLETVRAELKTVKDGSAKLVLDGLQGVKFAPAEREDLDKLVADVGIDRVKGLLEKRADLNLTQAVTVGDKLVATQGKAAPPPVEGSSDPDAGSDDLLKAAHDGATKAA